MPYSHTSGKPSAVSGKGAKKAAQIQADAATKQQAFLQGMYDQNKGMFSSDINNGDVASTRIMDLLGLGQGGAASQPAAFDMFRSEGRS